MGKKTKNWKKEITGLAIALGIGFLSWPSYAQSIEFSYGSITKDTTLVPIESIEYLVKARPDGNGTIFGTVTNDYVSESNRVTFTAVADSRYKFSSWSGDVLSTNSELEILVDKPYTNIVANFVPIETQTNDVGFASISFSQNQVALEIASSTNLNTTYSVYSSTNLPDNYWEFRTSALGTGSFGSNLIFNLDNSGKKTEFYKATEEFEK